MRRISLFVLLALSLATVPGTAAAAESETPFCESHTLHDYLAPMKRLPKVREPPFRATGRDIHFRGLEIAASGPTLAVSGGRAGYQLNWDTNPRWDITVTLARVDWRGRFMWLIGWRHLRLGELGAALITEPNIGLPRKPGVYRSTIVIRTSSGRKLAKFSNHYRVVRPTVHARLTPISPTYSPGATLFARLENPGAAFALFGEEHAIERLEGESWAPAPELPGDFTMPLQFVAPGKTSGRCIVFQIPTSMPLGRYRISQEVIFGWPRQPRDNEPRPRMYAEFDVVP